MSLTPSQEAFCQHFAVHRSGPAAYVHAYNVGQDTLPASIASGCSRILRYAKIQSRIREIQAAAVANAPVTITVTDLLMHFLRIATADPRELTKIRKVNCRHCWGDDHGYQWDVEEYFKAEATATKAGAPAPDLAGGFGWEPQRRPHEDCPKCGGAGHVKVDICDTDELSEGGRALYGGAKINSRGEVEIIMADQVRAAENVGKILGAFNERLVLSGEIGAMAAVVTANHADPQAALKAYQDMIAKNLPAK